MGRPPSPRPRFTSFDKSSLLLLRSDAFRTAKWERSLHAKPLSNQRLITIHSHASEALLMPIGLLPRNSLFGWLDCQRTFLAFLSIMMIVAHQTARIVGLIAGNVFLACQCHVALVTAEMFDVELETEREIVF